MVNGLSVSRDLKRWKKKVKERKRVVIVGEVIPCKKVRVHQQVCVRVVWNRMD